MKNYDSKIGTTENTDKNRTKLSESNILPYRFNSYSKISDYSIVNSEFNSISQIRPQSYKRSESSSLILS
jgi:hypothetical protein